jgi:cytochrome c-type biogenesis protein CcmE
MKRNQLKFVVGSAAMVAVLGYLAMSGLPASMSFYQTVPQMYASGDKVYSRRLNVTGEVVPGSITHQGQLIKFVVAEKLNVKGDVEGKTLPVHYISHDPLPDTFHDRSTATVMGTYGKDGIFVADKVTAKCASKYEKEQAAGILQPADPSGAAGKAN